MSARRRSKSKRKVLSSTEKWKNKVWVEIRSPPYITDKVIGHTPAADPEMVIGRTVKVQQPKLTGNFKDFQKIVTLQVKEVNGTIGQSDVIGYELSRENMRSMVRNHRSRIDGIYNIKFNDDTRIRMTVFCVTPVRAKSSEKKVIRSIISEAVDVATADLSFPAFINKVLDGSIVEQVREKVAEYFPTKTLEISKIKVLKRN